MNSPPTEELSIGRFKFVRDKKGELVEIPTETSFKGFLVHQDSQTDCHRIHILTSGDLSEHDRYLSVWDTVRNDRNTSLFPEVVECGLDDGIPYYVSRFPHGEPLTKYLENSPPWPGQLTARVLCRFISSIRFQESIPLNQYSISYDSLWIEKTIYGPRLLIGDIAFTRNPAAGTDNAALLLSVFKDLTKEEQHDPAITELFKKMANGPMSIGHVESGLKSFSITGDSRELSWTESCEPSPFLDHCLSKVDLVSKGNLIEKKGSHRKKSRSLSKRSLGNFLSSGARYRPAIELDPSARKSLLPRRLVAFATTAAIILILIFLSLFTDRGKALIQQLVEFVEEYSYQPSLVITPEPERETLRAE